MKWVAFSTGSLLDLMLQYLKKGMMREVMILWQRHTHEDAVREIDQVLSSLPLSLPYSCYKKWLQADVLPSLIRYIESTHLVGINNATTTLQAFMRWLLKRVRDAANGQEIQTALELSRLLMPSSNIRLHDSNIQWASVRMMLVTKSNEESERNECDQLQLLAQQLEHMMYLEEHHDFKISLSLFAEVREIGGL